jgi:hypothetical protein
MRTMAAAEAFGGMTSARCRRELLWVRVHAAKTCSQPYLIQDESGAKLIPLTTVKVRRPRIELFAGECTGPFNLPAAVARPPGYHARTSRCRRQHQAMAQRCHYKRRLQLSNRTPSGSQRASSNWRSKNARSRVPGEGASSAALPDAEKLVL